MPKTKSRHVVSRLQPNFNTKCALSTEEGASLTIGKTCRVSRLMTSSHTAEWIASNLLDNRSCITKQSASFRLPRLLHKSWTYRRLHVSPHTIVAAHPVFDLVVDFYWLLKCMPVLQNSIKPSYQWTKLSHFLSADLFGMCMNLEPIKINPSFLYQQ